MKFKRNDGILLGIIILLILGSFGAYRLFYHNPGGSVQITVDSKTVKTLPLDKDTTYTVKTKDGKKNVLEIKNNQAFIRSADCPDKLCVHQKAISNAGESLVCLPHKVVITIVTDKQNELDGVAN